jgi:hypothetical protein
MKKILPFLAAALVQGCVLSYAEERYDGAWWLAHDPGEQAKLCKQQGDICAVQFNFLDGYSLCSVSFRDPKAWPRVSFDDLRSAITLYYRNKPTRLSEPVAVVVEKLLPTLKPLPDLGPGNCPANTPRGRCYTGEEWWEIASPLPDSECNDDPVCTAAPFVAGFLECYRRYGPRNYEFPQSAEYYAKKINEFYGIEPHGLEGTDMDGKVAHVPVVDLLLLLAERKDGK